MPIFSRLIKFFTLNSNYTPIRGQPHPGSAISCARAEKALRLTASVLVPHTCGMEVHLDSEKQARLAQIATR
jgi:hypothetical protein